MPLFEKASMSNERIMSKSETFSSDFRSIALKALKSIVNMSSLVDDEMVQRKLAENSAITVLSSLLYRRVRCGSGRREEGGGPALRPHRGA